MNEFIETTDIVVEDYTITFRIAGMTEFYDVIDDINQATEKNSDVRDLQAKIDVLEKVKKRTEAQEAELLKNAEELNGIFITGDKHIRQFLIDHTLKISKNGKTGTEQEAKWFIDRRDTETLATLFHQVKPDIDKNSQSQS